MKIAVYVSAVPSKTKNDFKRDLLKKFAAGARAAGDDVDLVDDVTQVVSADIAVLQGWIGMKTAPHLEQRRRVIKHQRKTNTHTLVIDSNLFGFLDPGDRDRYLRYSLNGIFPTTGYYFDRDIDPNRWSEIKHSYSWVERDWQTTGQNILICLQRDGGWSMDGLDILSWLDQIIPILRLSSRSIIIRPHPGSLRTIAHVQARWPDIAISELTDIRDDFARAWCTVVYNSSPAVASLMWGVPAFVTDPLPARCQAWPCINTDLACVDRPQLFDRQNLYYKLAQCHFATATLESGDAWRFMRARLP